MELSVSLYGDLKKCNIRIDEVRDMQAKQIEEIKKAFPEPVKDDQQ